MITLRYESADTSDESKAENPAQEGLVVPDTSGTFGPLLQIPLTWICLLLTMGLFVLTCLYFDQGDSKKEWGFEQSRCEILGLASGAVNFCIENSTPSEIRACKYKLSSLRVKG